MNAISEHKKNWKSHPSSWLFLVRHCIDFVYKTNQKCLTVFLCNENKFAVNCYFCISLSIQLQDHSTIWICFVKFWAGKGRFREIIPTYLSTFIKLSFIMHVTCGSSLLLFYDWVHQPFSNVWSSFAMLHYT